MPTSKPTRGQINIGTPTQSTRTLPGIAAQSGDTAQLRQLPIDLIEPDPGQARHILPPGLRERFLRHELDAPQALTAWVALARQDPLEAKHLAEIASLAHSLKHEGQVKPLTVVRSPAQGRYRIETGERRFWAHQYAVHELGHKDQELIDAIVRHEARRARQAVENLFAESLTAIAFGRMVAQLLLEKEALQITDPGRFIGRDLTAGDFRELAQARVKRGGWEAVVATTGKQEDLLANHLRLLTLPEEVLVAADRGGLSERALRAVARLADPALQLRVVRLAAELDLTAGQVQALATAEDLDALEAELRANQTPAAETAPEGPAGRRPSAKRTPARAQHAPSRVLWTRVQALREFRQRMLKGKQNPTKVLAGEIAKQGKDAEQDIRETITFLEAVLRELKTRR
jgi:ParB-like chromosome segregation protein Spo0J